MDPRERLGDPLQTVHALTDALQARLWTSLPALVVALTDSGNTVTLQPAIQARVQAPDGSQSNVSLPLLIHCPVLYLSAGGFSVTVPVQAGDEGFVFFASRCLDGWWAGGGVQPALEARFHDLSDGFFYPGGRSQPRALAGVSTDSLQIRSDDGQCVIEVGPGHAISLIAPDGVTIRTTSLMIDAPSGVTISGNVAIEGGLSATGEGVFNGHSVGQHVHGSVQRGPSVTDGPQG